MLAFIADVDGARLPFGFHLLHDFCDLLVDLWVSWWLPQQPDGYQVHKVVHVWDVGRDA